LAWCDLDHRGRGARLVSRIESVGVPFRQAWATRHQRRDAVAVVAMFESEAHGLALWRRLTGRRRPPLVVIACWLTDLVVDSPARRRVYRQLYRSVDAVVVFSSNQVPILVELLGLDPRRIVVVPFGIDLDELSSIDVSEVADVVAIGRDLGRDWATLAAAAAGTGWHVDLVTRPHQVASLRLPPEVQMQEPVDRNGYLALLASASVVVVPTEVRQYPTGQTVLLEAMALGKACIVTDTPAMREYVADGETAVLVPPHDPIALRAAVDELRRDPQRRHRIAQAARRAERDRGGAAAMWAQVASVIDAARPGPR